MRRGKLGHHNGSFYSGVSGNLGDLTGLGAILRHCKVLLEHVPMGCLLYDTDFKLLYSNPAASAIFGYSPDELLGSRPEFIVPPAEIGQIDRVLDRLMQSESDTMSMNRNRRKDGTVIICSWVNTPLFDTQGTYLGMLSMVRDISGNVKLVEDLRQMVERYESLVNSMGEGMVIADREGRYIFANPAMERIYGGPVGSILGRRAEDFVVETEHPKVAEQLRLREAGESSSYQTRIRAADGSLRTVEVTGAPRYDANGNYDGLVALIQDVSDRVEADRALKESEEKYRILFEANPQAMILADVESATILMANAAAQQMYGYSEAEFLGLQIRRMRSPETAADFAQHWENLKQQQTWSGVVKHVRRDGECIDVQIHSNRIDFAARPARLILLQDITESLRAEERSRASDELASAVIENSPIGITVRDGAGHLLLHNSAWQRMWNPDDGVLKLHREQSAEDFVEMLRGFYGDDADRITDVYRLGGSAVQTEIQMDHERAPTKWISQYFYSIQAPDGSVERVVTLTEDISEARQAQQLAQQAEELAASVIQASPLAISVRDRQGQLILFNETWRSLYRMTEAELARSSQRGFEGFIAAMQPYYQPDDLRELVRLYTEGGEYTVAEVQVTKDRREDEYRWVSRHNYAIKDKQESVQFVVTLTRDITDEKAAAERLASSEQLSRAVIDNSPLGICVRTRDGRLISHNAAWKRIRGLSDAEIERQRNLSIEQRRSSVLSYYGPEAGPQVLKLYTEGGTLFFENLVLHDPPPCAARIISQHMYSLNGENGQVERVVILTQDVSAAHDAAELVRQNEERFRLAAAVTSDALYEWDIVSDRTWRSDSYFRLFGLPATSDNVTGGWFSQRLHPEDRDRVLQSLREALADQRSEWTAEYRFQDGAGVYRFIADRSLLVYSSDGRPAKMVGAISDVTEQREAAQHREAAERLSRLVIENATIGITVRSGEGRLLLFNERWREIWGVEQEEIDSNFSFDLVQTRQMLVDTFGESEADSVMQLFERAGTHRIDEVRWQRSPDPADVRWISMLFCSVEDGEGNVSQMVSLTVDNTDAIQADHRMRDSEQQLRQIIDLVPHFIFAKDAEGRFLLVNRAVADAYGTSVEELTGRSDSDFNSNQAEVERFRQADLKVIESNETLVVEREEITDATGEVRVLQTTKIPFTARMHHVPAVLGVSIDITVREKMERELRESEELLLQAQTIGHIGSWQLNCETREIVWSPETYEIFGVQSDYVPALDSIWGLVHPEDRVWLQEKVESAIQQQKYPAHEYRVLRPDGKVRWVHVEGRFEPDPHTGELCCRGVCQDVTERLNAERELRESEARYRTLLSLVPDAITVTRDGKLVYANEAAAELAGKASPDELHGREAASFVPAERQEEWRARWASLGSGGTLQPAENELVFDGLRKSVESVTALIRLDNEPAYLTVMRDISERKRAEASLRLRDEMLEAIAYAAPQFSGGSLEEEKIEDLLARLGQAARASCVYLLQRNASDSGVKLLKRMQWVAAEDLAPSLDLPADELGFNELAGLFGRGQPALGNVSDFSDATREVLADYGLKAFLIVPLFIGEEWWGFIGMEDRQVERIWSTAEVDVLRLAANLLGTAMARTRALEQLRASEERYRSLVNVSPDGIYVASSGVFRFANPTLAALLGLQSVEELIGRSVADFVHPDYVSISRERRIQLESEGGSLPVIEEVFLRADGSPITVEVASTSIRYADEPAAIVVLRDVTERKQAQSLLRLRDEVLRAIAYSAPQFVLDEQWDEQLGHLLEGLGRAAGVSRVFVYERVNERSGRQLACLRGEWVAAGVYSWSELQPMAEIDFPGTVFEDSIRRAEAGEVVQKSRVRPDGSIEDCMETIGSQSLMLVPIYEGRAFWGFIGFDDQQSPHLWSEAEVDSLRLASSVIGAAIARQRSNDRLRRSEERYRSLVDVSPDGILVCRGGTIEFANSTMARLVGAPDSRELIGRRMLDFVHPEYRDLSRERFRLQSEQLGSLPGLDERWLRLDGTSIDVEVASALIDQEEEPQAIVVVRDITDRKQAQSSLRMRDAILEAIAKVAPKLLAGPLSRDLRNELLEGIGRAANVSRVAVFEFHPDESGRRAISCRSEWVAPGIPRHIDNPWMQNIEVSGSPFSVWDEALSSGETVQGSISTFPETLRDSLAFLDLKSLLLAPIFVGNEWWGNIGFDDCVREREWSYAEVDALKLAASLIGAAVQRERAQVELQASEERFRLVNAATSDALYDWDIQGHFVWRSDSYYEFFDLEAPASGESETWWDEHIHPEDLQYATNSLDQAIARGEDRWSCEYRFLRGDGSFAEVADRGIIVRDNMGRALRMIGAISDITARSQSERRMKESEERYRLLAENSSDMISKNTPEGIFTYVSDSCYDLLGYRKEEMLGTSTYDYFHPEDLEQVARSHSAVLRGQSVQSITYRFRRKDGSYVWFETLTRPAQDEGLGTGLEIIATSRDVTERRQAELALRESEQRYRTLYNNTPVMLHSIDREGRIISVSDYWLTVMGYTRGEVLGRSALDFVSEQSVAAAQEMMELFLSEGYCLDFELQFIKRSGDRMEVLTSAIAERNDDGSLQRGLAVMADITERKRAQSQLQLSVEQLRSIYEFSQICGQSGSQEELLAAALEALRNTARPLKAGLMLPRSDGPLRFSVWLGIGPELRNCIENYTAWQAGLQESLLILDVDSEELVEPCRKALNAEGVGALAFLPVKHLNRVVGWCLMGYEQAHVFSRDERQLAETILSQLGSALERRRNELELRDSERGLALAQELARLGSWQWGIETGQTIWSDELYRIVGLEPGSISPRGLSILEYVHPEDQDEVHEALQSVLDNGIAVSIDFRVLRPSGAVVYVHSECIPELSPHGQVMRVGGTVQDVSERVSSQNDLLLARDQAEQNRMRASAILDAAPEAIIMIDDDGIIDTYSEGAERIFGYAADEMIGRTLDVLMREDDKQRHEEGIRRVSSSGRSMLVGQSLEVVGRHKDGHYIDLELTIRDTYLGGRRMFVGVMRDISERKRMQSQLRQSQKMEAIGTLAGGIAHDFNNILQSILGYTGLARDSVEGGHEAEEYLSVVMKAGLRARDLVQQILAFSRQSDLQLSVVDLSLIVRESTKLLRAAMPSTISIKTEMADRDVQVLGDPVQLHQVLMNLCTNAGYAMRDTGGTLSVGLRRVFWDAEFARFYPDLHPGLYAELSVTDTGDGISKEVLERIFEPFFTTKPVGEGTGMGLSVVHGIIHSLGGAIHVNSELGQGTSFKVYLPMVDAAPVVEEKKETEAPVGNERILLVDDEEAIADMVGIMLGRLGYRVSSYTDARQALKEFSERPGDFDLLITDQTMPFMTGAVLSAKALETRPDLPIIVCTGYSEMFTPEQAQEMGVQAYLYKPVGMMDLAQTIRQVLARSRTALDSRTGG